MPDCRLHCVLLAFCQGPGYKIQLSIFYATWTAAGTVSAALIGIFLFGQQISAIGWLAIAGMIVGIFVLNLFGTPKEPMEKEREEVQ